METIFIIVICIKVMQRLDNTKRDIKWFNWGLKRKGRVCRRGKREEGLQFDGRSMISNPCVASSRRILDNRKC